MLGAAVRHGLLHRRHHGPRPPGEEGPETQGPEGRHAHTFRFVEILFFCNLLVGRYVLG